jgi:integrase
MNPVRVKRGELPKKIDKDPEWRAQAIYTKDEVQQLIGDPRIPVERRVLWSLKALAGLRHGEAAALRWRHYDVAMEPLGRLTIAMSFDSHLLEEKRTKTETTRYVPVHPLLAEILKTWREQHWETHFGRKPVADDFIVPGPEMVPVNKNDACGALKFDLKTLGLRVAAGKFRSRGGHDLRSWFKTATIEDGADSDLIRRCTHAPPKDVDSGYKRFSWSTYCREVAKLSISLKSFGGVLTLGTPLGTPSDLYGPRHGNYWRNGWRR